MHNHLQTNIIIGILLSGTLFPSLCVAEEARATSDKKRIAVAIPKQIKEETVSEAVVVTPSVSPVYVPAKPITQTLSTISQSGGSGSKSVSTNVSGPADLFSTIEDTARKNLERLERMSSVYDKRMGQMLAWFANIMMPSTSITPVSTPSVCSKQRNLKILASRVRDDRKRF